MVIFHSFLYVYQAGYPNFLQPPMAQRLSMAPAEPGAFSTSSPRPRRRGRAHRRDPPVFHGLRSKSSPLHRDTIR